RTHPDGKRVAYAFSNGVDVTVTDEENKVTFLDHFAFGDPDEVRLGSVGDPANQTASYGYNAVGSLTGGTFRRVSRTFAYTSRNQLQSEANPENGTVSYSY